MYLVRIDKVGSG